MPEIKKNTSKNNIINKLIAYSSVRTSSKRAIVIIRLVRTKTSEMIAITFILFLIFNFFAKIHGFFDFCKTIYKSHNINWLQKPKVIFPRQCCKNPQVVRWFSGCCTPLLSTCARCHRWCGRNPGRRDSVLCGLQTLAGCWR